MQLTRPFKTLSLAQKDELTGYLFVAPQMIGFFLFVLGPILAIFLFSTQERNLLTGVIDPVGFQNFQTMFETDRLFPKVLANSLLFTGGLVPLNMILSLTLAMLL